MKKKLFQVVCNFSITILEVLKHFNMRLKKKKKQNEYIVVNFIIKKNL